MLKGEGLNYIFDIGKPSEFHALKDITVQFGEKKLYGILGPSGSGKSSLLYLLSGLRKPTKGRVIFENNDMWTLSSNELAEFRNKNFGFVFQRHFLINYLTSLENVLVPVNKEFKKYENRAKELLCDLGIEKCINKRPFEMSGGQRQRVAIARALINEPKVVFGDEPTASLDHENAIAVMDFLNSYKSNATIIVVTHDKSILTEADGEIRIIDGTLKEGEY